MKASAASLEAGMAAKTEAKREQEDPLYIERRRLLVILCSFCTALSYCDRVNMSVAVTEMSKELQWDMHQRASVLAAFFWGYIWSQIPGAYLAQKYGGHVVLGVAAFAWSISTLIVPLLARYSHTYVVYGRILLGICEGSTFPVIYHLFASRVPKDERSRALGSINFGVFGGAVFSFAASPVMMHHFHWSSVFYFFGSLGMLWVLCWGLFAYYIDIPDGTTALPCMPPRAPATPSLMRAKPSAPSEGPTLLQQARLIVCHKVVGAIFYAHFCHNIAAFVLMSWLPTYFEEAFDLGGSSLALSCLPYIVMGVAVTFTSTHADRFIARGELPLSTVRRISTITGFVGAGTFMLLITTSSWVFSAITYMCLALACNGAGPVAGYEAAKLDVAAPEYVGRLQSISNTLAAFAGIIGVPTVAYIKEATGSWEAVFLVMGAVFYSAALVFHTFGHYSGKVVPG
ncbi:Vesicular glutamate transporter 1 [Hondaea fermentalgiana]|uniref:Vesicular glutamate transporter 1 n=1 Tax=Hondaea fermentalgiana TaxID=2315210 RepID=A0A2R5GAR3_9STRA|nr:Vesicular glutamate transporter 1 [Hondaea fermentalgiana]|eukprot:GBG28097.1 Vesicular glutamate transporter 1 [Hondaea fermentalgiana]